MKMDYQQEYIRRNPTMHLEQASLKAAQILGFLPELKITSLLDVACGAGGITEILVKNLSPKEAVGLDISYEMIKVAKDLYKDSGIQWLCEDIFMFSPKQKYDLVLCIDILEHIPDDFGFLRKVSTLGRKVFLKIPMEDSFLDAKIIKASRLRDPWKESEEKYGHIHHYNEKQLLDMFRLSGLKILKESYIPLPRRSLLFYEILRIIFLPIGWFSRKAMANFVGGFKVVLLEPENKG